jgi:ABC-2 type transport system permease protein
MSSWRRIRSIVVKELRQLSRDRLTFGMIIGLPTLQLLMFGYAINMDVRNLEAAVADQANTAASRHMIQELAHSQVINISQQVDNGASLESLLQQGVISVGILIPPDFERRRLQPGRPNVQMLVDGSDPVVLSAASQLAGQARTSPYNDRPSDVEIRPYYNPERRSPVNTVPGLIGVILTMTMILFTAVAIVRERERGNLELLITTPIKSGELMLAKIIPYIGIGLIQASLVLLLGSVVFQVPMRGSLLDVYMIILIFIVANLGLGLFISTMSKTQFQAMQMTMFVLLPSILLSGFMFPFDGMPKIAQNIAEALPMTHFVRLIRGAILRGADLADMRSELLILVIFACATIFLATLRFRKRLD